MLTPTPTHGVRARTRGKPKALQAAETRALLIGTARRLFAERGFARVSLQDVLLERGLTKGAIYHHFRDKQALFHAVVVDVQASIAEAAAQAGARGGDPWLALERVCRAFFRELQRPDAMRIVCQDAGVVLSWAECGAIDERYMLATLRRFIDEAADAGLLPPVDRDALQRIITGAIYHTVEWASHDQAARRIAAGERTLLLMLRALKSR